MSVPQHDRRMRRHDPGSTPPLPERDKVSEASIDSFPASDPPGWIDGSATVDAPGEPVDLNAADAAELDRAFGIGREVADRIVRHRTEKLGGSFRHLRELIQVDGVDVELADRIARRAVIG